MTDEQIRELFAQTMQAVAAVNQTVQANAQQVAQNTRDIAETQALQQANAEQIAQNGRDIAENTRVSAENNRAIESLTVFAQAVFLRLDQMEAQIATQGNYITTLQGQTQDTINQVRDNQVVNNRILERLTRLDGGQ